MMPTCGRRECRCTHDCDHGWLPHAPLVRHGVTYERDRPCPVCRPELWNRLAREAFYA